jgi:hypothetical protein
VDVPEIAPVELSSAEQKLFEQINYDERALADLHPQNPEAMFDASAKLTRALLDRQAIPEVRLRYFDDPEYNVGGHGKSRQDVFISNGCHGEDILRRPHYFKYLRYFVLGPDLPPDVIAGFRQIVIDDCGTSGMILDQLRAYARAQMRRLKTPARYDLHEEFFKLALECGVGTGVALSVRRAAQSAR